MVDWRSEEVEKFCDFMFKQMTVFVFGVYTWYMTLTARDVEWHLVTQQLKFYYDLVPYLLGRYMHLCTLSMLVVVNQLGSIEAGGCHSNSIMRSMAIIGNLPMVCSSTNLQLRALRIWRHHRCVVAFLFVLGVFHWVFCFQLGLLGVRTVWEPTRECHVLDEPIARRGLLAFYLYTIIWDIVILALTVVALRKQHDARSSPLWHALLTQGVGYVAVTCMTNIPMTVMVWLNLNYTMSIFFTIPGNTASVIASSAAVTSLLKIKEAENRSPRSRIDIKRQTSNALTTAISLTSSAFWASTASLGADLALANNSVCQAIE